MRQAFNDPRAKDSGRRAAAFLCGGRVGGSCGVALMSTIRTIRAALTQGNITVGDSTTAIGQVTMPTEVALPILNHFGVASAYAKSNNRPAGEGTLHTYVGPADADAIALCAIALAEAHKGLPMPAAIWAQAYYPKNTIGTGGS